LVDVEAVQVAAAVAEARVERQVDRVELVVLVETDLLV
jgi:hypothetical protein